MAEIWQHIKQQWSRFKAWQVDPASGMQPADRTVRHHCANCGREFTGRYCSECSQRAGSGRITWYSIRQGVMELWGLGTRSLPYTLWQLLWRPGYLIGDYIRGKHQMSFPPIKMLVFVAVFALLLFDWTGFSTDMVTDGSEATTVTDTKERFIDMLSGFMMWSSHHYDWFMLFLMSLFIIPTYFIFRHSPRCPRHTLPEGFFIQVFNATMMLLLLVVIVFITKCFEETEYVDSFISVMMTALPLMMLWRNYHQLFGYGWWGNTWRMALVLVVVAVSLMLLLLISYTFILAFYNDWSRALNRFLYRIVPLTLCFIGLLYAIHRFDRYKARRDTTDNNHE